MNRCLIAAVALALIGSPALAADRFDLVCTGTTTTSVGGGPEDTQPWNDRFSVDLTASAYCGKGCNQIGRLARVDPGQIVFTDEGKRSFFEISRTDGTVLRQFDDGLTISDTAGRCSIEPFTPLPKTLF